MHHDTTTRRRIRGIGALTAAVLVTATLMVGGADAYPSIDGYSVLSDEQGIDDVPGQKDLTQQGWQLDGDHVDVFFNFDEVVTRGGNTLTGCTLFDSDGDGLTNFALCAVTGARDSSTPQSSTLYSCRDVRVDRCANATVVVAPDRSAETTCGYLNKAQAAAFMSDADADTRVYCTVMLADVGAESAELLNTCAYSSAEPNSDPADCVRAPDKADPSATGATWVYPNATISVTGWAEGGISTGDYDKVQFALYDSADCSTTALYTQTVAAGTSVTTTNTSVKVETDGTYYWHVVYTGNNLNNPFTLSCGTLQTTVDL